MKAPPIMEPEQLKIVKKAEEVADQVDRHIVQIKSDFGRKTTTTKPP